LQRLIDCHHDDWEQYIHADYLIGRIYDDGKRIRAANEFQKGELCTSAAHVVVPVVRCCRERFWRLA
jgi:hypothetical protein